MDSNPAPARASRSERTDRGPTVELVALPEPHDVWPSDPEEVDAHLARIETARQRQLDALPASNTDPVTAAHRATVEAILTDVRNARRRLREGTYGSCVRCGADISVQQLQRLPWTAVCADCPAQR